MKSVGLTNLPCLLGALLHEVISLMQVIAGLPPSGNMLKLRIHQYLAFKTVQDLDKVALCCLSSGDKV